jgi:predicted CoA-binding protein
MTETNRPATAPPVNAPDAIEAMLAMRVIAVVGLSDDPGRASYGVARYMQQQGYEIIPVNPLIREALGRPAYASLADIGRPVELVDIFRRSEYVGAIVDEAIAAGARGIWMQLGVQDAAAAERARAAGLYVVMNRCLMVDHANRA